jgi:hypothetical protein
MTLVTLLCRALNNKYGNKYNYVAHGTNGYDIYCWNRWIMYVDDECIYFIRSYSFTVLKTILFNDPKIDVFAEICVLLHNRGYEPYP